MVRRAYLALGSNLGDRLAYLQRAVEGLAETDDVDVVAVSRVYETEPVGGPPQGRYLNAVVAVDTRLDPHALLALGLKLEDDAGRVRTVRDGPRTLDVDVLLYDDLTLDDPELTIPHPRMWERDFVLAPLRDVAPELVAPDRVPPRGTGRRDATTSGEGVRVAPVALRHPRHRSG